jgi:hypothetical protein
MENEAQFAEGGESDSLLAPLYSSAKHSFLSLIVFRSLDGDWPLRLKGSIACNEVSNCLALLTIVEASMDERKTKVAHVVARLCGKPNLKGVYVVMKSMVNVLLPKEGTFLIIMRDNSTFVVNDLYILESKEALL